MLMLQQGIAGHGYTVFAHQQTAGKGQRGKAWDTEAQSNILLSSVLDVSFLTLQQQFMLSAMVALAVHDFFSAHAGDATRIKWPNDIYWQNRKAGGILIENVVRGSRWNWAIVGIGLNINQASFPEHLTRAVSLRQVTGQQFDLPTLAMELCACLEKHFKAFKEHGGIGIIDSYNAHLFKRNEEVLLKKGDELLPCVINAVDQEGQLLVSNDRYSHFRFGEVEWLFR